MKIVKIIFSLLITLLIFIFLMLTMGFFLGGKPVNEAALGVRKYGFPLPYQIIDYGEKEYEIFSSKLYFLIDLGLGITIFLVVLYFLSKLKGYLFSKLLKQ